MELPFLCVFYRLQFVPGGSPWVRSRPWFGALSGPWSSDGPRLHLHQRLSTFSRWHPRHPGAIWWDEGLHVHSTNYQLSDNNNLKFEHEWVCVWWAPVSHLQGSRQTSPCLQLRVQLPPWTSVKKLSFLTPLLKSGVKPSSSRTGNETGHMHNESARTAAVNEQHLLSLSQQEFHVWDFEIGKEIQRKLNWIS